MYVWMTVWTPTRIWLACVPHGVLNNIASWIWIIFENEVTNYLIGLFYCNLNAMIESCQLKLIFNYTLINFKLKMWSTLIVWLINYCCSKWTELSSSTEIESSAQERRTPRVYLLRTIVGSQIIVWQLQVDLLNDWLYCDFLWTNDSTNWGYGVQHYATHMFCFLFL